jgi:hypothetical protein
VTPAFWTAAGHARDATIHSPARPVSRRIEEFASGAIGDDEKVDCGQKNNLVEGEKWRKLSVT